MKLCEFKTAYNGRYSTVESSKYAQSTVRTLNDVLLAANRCKADSNDFTL